MGLISLTLQDFRCFAQAELVFSPQTNLVWGENASGKTSVLEAIFLVGRGRSFRTGHLDPVSRFGSKGFQVVAQVAAPFGTTPVGLARQHGNLKARIGGRPAAGLAELAETLPVQLVDSQAHLLVDGSPRYRRQFLDWGVFHVEPGFFAIWQRYQRALQQRNALLRGGRPAREIAPWDSELISSGESLDLFRRRYLDGFSQTAERWSQEALGELAVSLEYRPGWPEGQSLAEALVINRERDRQQGGTQTGPHRADILIKVDGRPARDRISRGQEKALAGTLLLAQTAVYRAATGRACVLLLDDLPSELDSGHLGRFAGQVIATGAQTVITAIDNDSLPDTMRSRVFHVEQGMITQMV